MRIAVLAAFWLAAALIASGCSESERSGATAPGAGGQKKFRIAVIPKGTTHDFWKSVHAGAQDAAAELGNIEIVWNGPDNEKDKEAQIKIVDTFVGERVDGICLAPIDRDAFVPVVKRAKQRGIPVVVFDSGLSDPSDTVSCVATDNYKGGVLAAEFLARILGQSGGVILLRYQAGSESTEQRELGFLETLARYDRIKLVSESQRVESDPIQAMKIGESLLRDQRERVAGVFTVCEPINKGMLQALENEKLAGKVRFVAFDSDPRILQGLRDRTVDGIVLQDPVRMGYLAVKTMAAHLAGQPVEKLISTGEELATFENMHEPQIRELLEPKQFQGK
ncbi:MAG: ABC transporter substrate-binding protein [Planctomycetaceae bacterium]